MGSRQPMTTKQALYWLAGVSILIRVVFGLVYKCESFADTRIYVSHAHSLLHLYSVGFDGIRTPGFPLILIMCGFNSTLVWLAHSIMGIAIGFMLFAVAMRETKNPAVALVIAIWYNLTLNMIAAEASLMAETLTTLLTAASILLTARIWDADRPRIMSYVYLGLITGAAFLTRPPIVMVAPVYFVLFLALRPAGTYRFSSRLKYVAAYTLTVSVIVLGWCALVWQKTGMFAPSTLMGYNMTQHTGGFMEYAPDKYAKIRDIYLKCRVRQIAGTGKFMNTIWQAVPELDKATGLSWVGLSRELQDMSMQMIREHPVLYAKSVFRAWVYTWDAPCMYFEAGFKTAREAKVFTGLLVAHRVVDILMNFVFLVIALYALYRVIRLRNTGEWAFRLFLMALILTSSVGCAITISGDNGRYEMPFQPWLTYVVIISVWRHWMYRKTAQLQGGGIADSIPPSAGHDRTVTADSSPAGPESG